MVVAFKAIFCYLTVISVFMLFQAKKKENISHKEICKQLDEVLKDKDYHDHLSYLQAREKEKKVLVYQGYVLNKAAK